MEAKIQFIKGLNEKVLPDVRLTRSRDGSTGTATFRSKKPNILNKNTTRQGKVRPSMGASRLVFRVIG